MRVGGGFFWDSKVQDCDQDTTQSPPLQLAQRCPGPALGTLRCPADTPLMRQCCDLKLHHRIFNRNVESDGEHWAGFALWRPHPESAPWHITTFRNIVESSKEEDKVGDSSCVSTLRALSGSSQARPEPQRSRRGTGGQCWPDPHSGHRGSWCWGCQSNR